MKEDKKGNITDEDFDLGKFLELASSDKFYVTGLNLHEFKNEVLLDYKGDFESYGWKIIGTVEQKTKFSFRNIDDFESYINAIDVEYDGEDVTFIGYVSKLNKPQSKVG